MPLGLGLSLSLSCSLIFTKPLPAGHTPGAPVHCSNEMGPIGLDLLWSIAGGGTAYFGALLNGADYADGEYDKYVLGGLVVAGAHIYSAFVGTDRVVKCSEARRQHHELQRHRPQTPSPTPPTQQPPTPTGPPGAFSKSPSNAALDKS